MVSIAKLPCRIIGMSMSEYLSAPGDSRSYICQVSEGGGEVQRWLDDGHSVFSGNSATTLGSQFDAILMGVIQGKGLGEQVAMPPADVLGKNGARSTTAYKEWAAKQEGKVVCSDEEYWKFQKMLDSVRENTSAWELISLTKITQSSCFAEVDGHPVKVRPDAECESLWWDLKTTSAPWPQIARSVKSYHYGEQEWLYREVAVQLGVPHFRMPFVFVSTIPPFGCCVYLLPEDYVEECGERMRSAMELIRLRRATGEYLPLDHGEVKELVIPDWVRRTQEVF